MAPNLSGYHDMDHIRSVDLVRDALTFAKEYLKPGKGGVLLAKVFQGRFLKGKLKSPIFKLTLCAMVQS